jgi:hypothetical protein
VSKASPSRGLIWATRGRSWGFRFLLDGGFRDPLLPYDHGFSGLEGLSEGWRRVGTNVALRIQDPEERRDLSGRLILHEFVVPAPLSNQVTSVEDGLILIWPLVSGIFERVWDGPNPPSADAIRSAVDRADPGSA